MPYKEKPIEKKYYTISEVAGVFNVATSLIRFWEGEFDVVKPKKNRKGTRLFTKTDVDNLKIIYHLVRERGFTLQGAKNMIQKKHEELDDQMKLIDSLTKVRSFLVGLKDNMH